MAIHVNADHPWEISPRDPQFSHFCWCQALFSSSLASSTSIYIQPSNLSYIPPQDSSVLNTKILQILLSNPFTYSHLYLIQWVLGGSPSKLWPPFESYCNLSPSLSFITFYHLSSHSFRTLVHCPFKSVPSFDRTSKSGWHFLLGLMQRDWDLRPLSSLVVIFVLFHPRWVCLVWLAMND